ncbi:MAG TPA: hypothetical protein VK762_26640 [Polyangiaceae bacterium]|jgi:hypothetical protein|nr:hypothetical protein [Polyangiaceae bacterium]
MRFGLTFGIVACLALASLLPTGLFLYVEPRGRNLWAKAGDSPSTRRAPALVRVTSWMSFLLGQVAIPWLLLPAVCAAFLYLQARLGIWKPVAMASTATAGVLALVQAALAIPLIPLGVRLLMRDAGACDRAASRARFVAMTNAGILGAVVALEWAMVNVPRFVHPWLGTALDWAVLRPEMMFGGACLAHALLLGRSARAAKT